MSTPSIYAMAVTAPTSVQVAQMIDDVTIYKINTDAEANHGLSTQLEIQGLPTMIFVGTDGAEPALRTEGLMPAESIKDIVSKLQTSAGAAQEAAEAAQAGPSEPGPAAEAA